MLRYGDTAPSLTPGIPPEGRASIFPVTPTVLHKHTQLSSPFSKREMSSPLLFWNSFWISTVLVPQGVLGCRVWGGPALCNTHIPEKRRERVTTDGREPGRSPPKESPRTAFKEQAGPHAQVSAKPSVSLPGSGLNYFLLKVEGKYISPSGPQLLIVEHYRGHRM